MSKSKNNASELFFLCFILSNIFESRYFLVLGQLFCQPASFSHFGGGEVIAIILLCLQVLMEIQVLKAFHFLNILYSTQLSRSTVIGCQRVLLPSSMVKTKINLKKERKQPLEIDTICSYSMSILQKNNTYFTKFLGPCWLLHSAETIFDQCFSFSNGNTLWCWPSYPKLLLSPVKSKKPCITQNFGRRNLHFI